MKNREVRAMLVAMAFSAATMTSCGAYGAVEEYKEDPVDVYGSIEYFDTEAAVYGPIEYFDSEYSDTESASELEHYQGWVDWEDAREQRDGFDHTSNSQLQFGSITFEIPSYLEEEETESEETDTLSFKAEESDTDFACMTMEREVLEIPSADGDFLPLLDDMIDEASADDHNVDMYDIAADECDCWIITRYENINGEAVVTYTAYYLTRLSDTQAEMVTVIFTTTDGCEYGYRNDFIQMIENSLQK